jgi:translocation and assembly module TamA
MNTQRFQESFRQRCSRKIAYLLRLGVGVMLLVMLKLVPSPVQAADVLSANRSPAYTVRFESYRDSQSPEEVQTTLARLLEKRSELAKKENRKPLPLGVLKRRARQELPRLLKALHARGYYDAILETEVEAGSEAPVIIFRFDVGEAYKVAATELALTVETPSDIRLPPENTLRPTPGKPVRASEVLSGAEKAESYIAAENCLMKVQVQPSLTLSRADKQATVHYEINAGPPARFGAITLEGNQSVTKEHIHSLLPWKQGDCFHANDISKAETALLASQLFASVSIKTAPAPNEQGQLPVTVQVTERFHRTVKAGVSYMTDEGPGISSSWEHRNFRGGGERLEAIGVISQLQYSLDTTYTLPAFLRDDQSLKISGRLAEERPDSYTSRNTSISATVERIISERLKAGLGAGYRLSSVEEATGAEETYGLIFLPGYGLWDSRNDALNPTEGILARLDITPYFDTLGSGTYFLKTLAGGSTYFALPGPASPVLAVRGALGSIAGDSTGDLPADLRFYAGGGSSVRGYGYQELSPERNGEPFGGKSLIEVSTELRLKFTETIGGAFFLDGGNAYSSEYPDFEENLRWGAGLGLRYYSDFGPLRLDVAFPLDKREDDSAFQLYVSLGQAF